MHRVWSMTLAHLETVEVEFISWHAVAAVGQVLLEHLANACAPFGQIGYAKMAVGGQELKVRRRGFANARVRAVPVSKLDSARGLKHQKTKDGLEIQ